MKIHYTIYLLFITCFLNAQTFTFDNVKLCKKSTELIEKDKIAHAEFISSNILPALSLHLENGKTDQYAELVSCSRIEEITSKNDGLPIEKMVEIKMGFDNLQLEYLKTQSLEQWIIAYQNKIQWTTQTLSLSLNAIDFNPNLDDQEKKKYKNQMANSAYSEVEEHIRYAFSFCDRLSAEQKQVHNELIHMLEVHQQDIVNNLCPDE